MDYSCAKFGDLSFSRFGFIMRTHTNTHRITDANDRYTHTITFVVSKARFPFKRNRLRCV